VEGVNAVDLESTGPATSWLVHHPNTEKVVEIDSWPVVGQYTVRQS